MDLKTYFSTRKQVDLARALGVTQGAVNQWSTGTKGVPLKRAIEIERYTAGVVTCEELCPGLADEISYLRGTSEAADLTNTQPATPAPADSDIEPAAAGQGV